MTENLTRAERRRLKRERSSAKNVAAQAKAQYKKIFYIIVFVIIIIGGIYWLTKSSGIEPVPSNEVSVTPMNQDHVRNTDNVVYNSNPPTSGPHFSDWHKEWKFYDSELPIGGLIHNMEHGGIVIFFKPDLAQDQKDLLNKFVDDNFKMIASTKADIPSPIALAAWGVYEFFDDFDEAAMKRFYKAHLNRSPENVYP